jgi:O-Antigen ligase
LKNHADPIGGGIHYTGSTFNFWVLVAFLVLVFLTGGSSRDDVQSLMVLRPLSILACGIALINLNTANVRGNKWLIGASSTILLVMLFYLIPLPPALWKIAATNDLPSAIGRLADLPGVWRPLALVPESAKNSIFSFFVPAAVFLLALRLDRKQLYQLIPVLLALGILSSLFGLLQLVGPTGSSLYLYRITNGEAAVGLFANRNHASLMLALLFPLLAMFAFDPSTQPVAIKGRQLAAALIAVILVPLVLITGSRSGLFIGVLGLLGSGLIYLRSRNAVGKSKNGTKFGVFGTLSLIGVAIACLGSLTFFLSRATAIDRLSIDRLASDNRSDFWPVTIDLIALYFPLGTGPGGFAKAYEVTEPSRLLDPTYLNRAHNDWIEVLVLMGAPGLILFLLAAALFCHHSYSLWKKPSQRGTGWAFSRMASIAIGMIAIGSFTDYPLHTPIMMSIFSIMFLWFYITGQNLRKPNRSAI